MYKRVASVVLAMAIAVPMMASAQSTTDLAAQIQALLAQVQTLQTQLASLQKVQTQGTTNLYDDVGHCVELSVSMGPGDEGPEVLKLQEFLIQEGVLESGANGTFGPLTTAAVQKWQSKNGIVYGGTPETTGYGFVGSRTRSKMACNRPTEDVLTTTTGSTITAQITALYKDILGRNPDTAGLNYWVGQVTGGAVTLDSVRRNFEATRDITKLYKDILGRDPDTAGLNYWVTEYLAGRSTLASIRQNFTNTWTAQNQSCPAGTGGTYPYCVTFTAAGSPTLSCSASTVAPGGNISGTVTGLTSGDATNRNLSVSVFKASDTLSSFSLAQAAGFAPSAIPVPVAGTAPSPQTVTFNVPTNASGTYQMRLVAGSALASCSFTVSGTVPITGATVIQSITALYKEVLGRDPDVAGLNYWAAQFNSGAVTMAKIRQNFEATRDITALYKEVLGREPDTAGLNYWVVEYLAGRSTLASIRQQFVNDKAKDAATNTTTTTNTSSISQQITALYQSILGRAPDTAGLAYWVAQVNSSSVSISAVQRNLEATRDITALYKEVLGREPDTAGLNYWITEYLAGRSTLASIRQQFVNDKAKDAASTANSSALSSQVSQMYRVFLSRDPDAAGLAYWVQQISSGAATIVTLQTNLIATRDITALYKEVLGREPDAGGLSYWVGEYLAGRSTLASIRQQFVNDKAKDQASTSSTGGTTGTSGTTNTTTSTSAPKTVSCSAGSTVSAAVGDSVTITIPSPTGAAWLGLYDWVAVYRASEPTTSNSTTASGFGPSMYAGSDSWGGQTKTFKVSSAAPGSYQIRIRNPQQDQSTGALTYNPITLCTVTVVSPTASADTSKSVALSQLASALAAILSIIGGQGR